MKKLITITPLQAYRMQKLVTGLAIAIMLAMNNAPCIAHDLLSTIDHRPSTISTLRPISAKHHFDVSAETLYNDEEIDFYNALIAEEIISSVAIPDAAFGEPLLRLELSVKEMMFKTSNWSPVLSAMRRSLRYSDPLDYLPKMDKPMFVIAAGFRSKEEIRKRIIRAVELGAKDILVVSGGGLSKHAREMPWSRLLLNNTFTILSLIKEMRKTEEILPDVTILVTENLLTGDTVDHAARLEKKIEAGAQGVILQPPLLWEQFKQWWDILDDRDLTKIPIKVGVPVITSVNNLYAWFYLAGIDKNDPEAKKLIEDFTEAESRGPTYFKEFRNRWSEELISKIRELPNVAGIHIMPLMGWRSVKTVLGQAGLMPAAAKKDYLKTCTAKGLTGDEVSPERAAAFLKGMDENIARDLEQISSNPENITEEMVDAHLGNSEEWSELRQEISYYFLEPVSESMRFKPDCKIYFLPGDALWEVDGNFTAGYFSKEKNAIYIKAEFIKFIRESSIANKKSPEYIQNLINNLVFNCTGYMTWGGDFLEVTKMLEHLYGFKHERLMELFKDAKTLQQHPELSEFNMSHPGVSVEMRSLAELKLSTSACLKILHEVYTEEALGLKAGGQLADIRVRIDRARAIYPFTQPIDVVAYYDSKEAMEQAANTKNVPIEITVNTRAFEHKGGLDALKEALRNAIRDHQSNPRVVPITVPGYCVKSDREERAIENVHGNRFFSDLPDAVIWNMSGKHWEHGRENYFLDDNQASNDEEFISWQVDDFFNRLLTKTKDGDLDNKEKIVIVELSAGSCKHADLWMKLFKERQDEYNKSNEKVDFFERLFFIIGDISKDILEETINKENTPFLEENRHKIMCIESDLMKIADLHLAQEADSAASVIESLELGSEGEKLLSKASLVMVNYVFNLMPFHLVSKREGVLYKRLARAYLKPEINDEFFNKHKDAFEAIKVYSIDDLVALMGDIDRYEKALPRLSHALIKELWRGIRLEYRCFSSDLTDPALESTEEILGGAGLNNITIPINEIFNLCIDEILSNWLNNKQGSLQILDTIIEVPGDFKRKFWDLRRTGISHAAWISGKIIDGKQHSTDARNRPTQVGVEMMPIRKIISGNEKKAGAVLTMSWRPTSELELPRAQNAVFAIPPRAVHNSFARTTAIKIATEIETAA